MVTVGIVAIVAGLAAPSMMDGIKNNRMQSTGAELHGLVKYARSQAIYRAEAISIGTIDNQTTWGDNTIVVWVDNVNGAGNNPTFQPNIDTELKRVDTHETMTISVETTGTVADQTWFGFSSTGAFDNSSNFANGVTGLTMQVCDDRKPTTVANEDIKRQRQISVFSSGIVAIQNQGCPGYP